MRNSEKHAVTSATLLHGRSIGFRKQARQESNLQPPVLETGALPIELRTFRVADGN